MIEGKAWPWAEIVFGIAGAAITVVLLLEAMTFPERSALFPVALLWCLLVTTVTIAGQAIFRTLKGRSVASAGLDWLGGFLVPAITLAVGGVVLAGFGFYVVAPFLILTFHMLHAQRSGRSAFSLPSLSRGAALALVATAGMYLVFDVLIGLPAPSGTLF